MTQTTLAVAVHNIRESVRRQNFVDSRAVQLFAGFWARIEMRNAETNAVGFSCFLVIAAANNRRTGANHIVEDDDIFAF